MNEDPQLSTSASRPGCSKKRGGGNLSLDAVPSAPGWEEKFVIHILADRSWPGDSGDRDWLTQIVQRWQRKREIQWLVVRQYTEQKPGDWCLLMLMECWNYWHVCQSYYEPSSIETGTDWCRASCWLSGLDTGDIPRTTLARPYFCIPRDFRCLTNIILHHFIQFGRANRKADRLNMRGTTYEGESDLTLPRKNFYFPILWISGD